MHQRNARDRTARVIVVGIRQVGERVVMHPQTGLFGHDSPISKGAMSVYLLNKHLR